MRTIFLTLILTLVFGSIVSAQSNGTLKVRVNQQKTHARSKLKITFVALVEDSRCPTGANCVWAGNAKIRVKITDARGRSETVEMNTNMGEKGASFGGYAVNLVGVDPRPAANIRINRNGYTATFEINKLTR
jgi:Na+-transporting NADH:ubiquinone oxidoreductase subunit NqrC